MSNIWSAQVAEKRKYAFEKHLCSVYIYMFLVHIMGEGGVTVFSVFL